MGMSMAACTHQHKVCTSTVERLKKKDKINLESQVFSSFKLIFRGPSISVHLYCLLVYYFENSHNAEIQISSH